MRLHNAMMRFCAFVLFISPLSLVAQDLTGLWYGSNKAQVTQNSKSVELVASVELSLVQEGELLTGYVHNRFPNSEIKMSIVGTVKGTKVSFKVQDVLLQKLAPSFYVCYGQFNLLLSQSVTHLHLQGIWTAVTGGCPNSDIALSRALFDENLPPSFTPSLVVPLPSKDTVKKDSLISRRTTVSEKVELRAGETIYLELFDDEQEDGDIITLVLNGNKILENFGVKKQVHRMAINIQKGENLLILHALSQGSIGAATVVVDVLQGDERQRVVLDSYLDKSDAIRIWGK